MEYIEYQRKCTFTCICGEHIECLEAHHTVDSVEKIKKEWDGDSIMCDKCGRWYDIYNDSEAIFVGIDSEYGEDDSWERYEE